jgi:hypothetical protein
LNLTSLKRILWPAKEASMRRMTVLALGLVFVTGASVALAAGPRGSRGNPYPIKTVVPLPEWEPWSLRVNSSIPNATR